MIMPYQLFSATGCSRCSLVKSFMERSQITFNELDIKATHNKKHKIFIQPVLPEKNLKLEPPAASVFFKYRTQCRRHMVLCEVKAT